MTVQESEGEGSILGSENTTNQGFIAKFQSFLGRHKLSSALTALILLSIIIYGIKQSRKKRK